MKLNVEKEASDLVENSKSIASNTGYKGIYFDKDRGKFRSQLNINNRKKNNVTNVQIGYYDTLKEALDARKDFIKSLL